MGNHGPIIADGACVERFSEHSRPIAYSGDCGERKAVSLEIAEIDAQIAQYTNAEHRIGVNLHAVGTDPVFGLVESGSLRGQSGRRGQSLAANRERLWPMYLGLQTTLDKARVLRGTKRRVSRRDYAELVELLTGASVVVEGETEPMTIDEALDALRATYEPLAEAVAHINEVLATALPRLSAYEESLARWERDAAVLDYRSTEIEAARRKVDELRARVGDDPLSIEASDLEAAAAAVKRAGVEVAQAGEDRHNLQGDLAALATAVSELSDLRAQAAGAYVEANKMIVNPIGLVAVPGPAAIDGPNGLRVRVEAVTANPGDWQTVRAAMDELSGHVDRLRSQLDRAWARNRMPLERRDELRGRLRAFRAKMDATSSGDSTTNDLADEIHNELYTAPSDLGRADQMLNELTSRLSRKART